MRNARIVRSVAFAGGVALAGVVSSFATQSDPVALPVRNAGFEICQGKQLPEGEDRYFYPVEEGWRHWQRDVNGGPVRAWNPGIPGVHDGVTPRFADIGFGGDAPEGNHLLLVLARYEVSNGSITNSIGGLNLVGTNLAEAAAQLLPTIFEPRTIYTLSVAVGQPPGSLQYTPNYYGYAVQIVVGGTNEENSGGFSPGVVGGTVIAEDINGLSVPVDGFVTSTVTYTPDPNDESLVGLPLQIRLAALEDPVDPEVDAMVVFDDVKMYAAEVLLGSLMILR